MVDEYYPQHSQTQQYQPYQQYQQPQYQQPQYQPAPQQFFYEPEATTTGQWVLTLFLMCIPLVNIILLFVWAFSSNTEPGKQNWARAKLIWILIAIIISVAVFAVAAVMGVDFWKYIRYR